MRLMTDGLTYDAMCPIAESRHSRPRTVNQVSGRIALELQRDRKEFTGVSARQGANIAFAPQHSGPVGHDDDRR
jgi:hypothetical protein